MVFTLNQIQIILIYIISLVNINCQEMFRDIKKLSLNNNYFVVLSTGLYLYDSKLINCSLIYEFNSTIYKNVKTIILLGEIKEEINSYILCLVDKYLFIYNEENKDITTYIISDININSQYCNLLPYKIIDGYICFIIVLYNDPKLCFYYYKLPIKDNIIRKNEISFDINSVEDYNIKCQINSYLSYINCFYCPNDNKTAIFSTKFLIEDMNIIKNENSIYTFEDYVNVVESALSFNNKFFICPSYGSNKTVFCYIKNYSENIFKIKEEYFGFDFDVGYKIFYFNESGDFMIIQTKVIIL